MRKHEFFRIRQLKRRYDKRTGKFIINIAYETAAPEPTDRVLGVAEAFGLGLNKWEKFTIYDNVELKISTKDIVYITGDSGSGKSVLLKALERDVRRDMGLSCINAAEIKPHLDKPLIETIGKTFEEALELLSRVGLNDAFLFLRSYKQLSDGQKYRYKIAKMVESGAQFWILDEFAATLDRDTAKIVAFNLQKLARQRGKAVIAATTHADLFEDLCPTVHIHKRFGREITVNYYPDKAVSECSVTRDMVIVEGSYADYKALSQFHYRSSLCPPARRVFVLKRGEELCGAIVYSYPPPFCFGRSKVWRGDFKRLQHELSTISRVVVHPKYRTVGLGARLVRETLEKAGTPFVEALAVMAKYNPFFERAGMKKIAESKPSQGVLWALERLCSLGFNPAMLGSVEQNLLEIKCVGKAKIIKILERLSKREGSVRKRIMASGRAYPSHVEFMQKIRGFSEEGLAKALKTLGFLAQTKVYLFWKKQHFLAQNTQI
jgi:ABC-type phosphate/phosphonate transport system ATPase subunit/GNAT superfamily N-acetyltransferase